MVTGRKAFEGESQASLITAIMSSEPPALSTLQPVTPLALDRIVETCLAKNPDDRWQHASDIKRQLEWILEGNEVADVHRAGPHAYGRRVPWILAALMSAVAALSVWSQLRETARPADPVTRLVVTLPEDRRLTSAAQSFANPIALRLTVDASSTRPCKISARNSTFVTWIDSTNDRSLGRKAARRRSSPPTVRGSDSTRMACFREYRSQVARPLPFVRSPLSEEPESTGARTIGSFSARAPLARGSSTFRRQGAIRKGSLPRASMNVRTPGLSFCRTRKASSLVSGLRRGVLPSCL